MAVKRFSNSLISQSGQDKVTNFIAGYSPAIDEMDLIERVIVGSGGAADITFSNIPQTYQHLQVRMVARDTSSNLNSYANLRLNLDSGTNYAWHYIRGNGSNAAAAGGASSNTAYIQQFVGGGASASIFGAAVFDILDYASTSKNKTVRSHGGEDRNGDGSVFLYSNLWINTNAVTSINMTPLSGNWAQYTTTSLYGIKA